MAFYLVDCIALSLVGQALLAVFVLSQLTLTGFGVGAAIIAIGTLVFALILAKDDMKLTLDKMQTDWELFKGEFGKGASLFDDLPDIITRAKILILDFSLWLNSIPILGLFQPRAVTEGLIARREELLQSLNTFFGGGSSAGSSGFTGTFGEPVLRVKPFEESFEIFNKEDAKKLEKMEEQRQTIITKANEQLAKFDTLITAVNNIDISVVGGGGGSAGGSTTS